MKEWLLSSTLPHWLMFILTSLTAGERDAASARLRNDK